MTSALPPQSLRAALAQAFSLSDLILLCSDLGVNPEAIPAMGAGIELWAREIVIYFQRRGQLPQLRLYCGQKRPDRLDIDWANLSGEALDSDGDAPAPTPLSQTTHTGGGAAIGGDVTAKGDVAGRDINITNQGFTADDVVKIVQAKQGEVAGRSFNVLAEVLNEPAIRDAALAFRTIFATTSERIADVDVNKAMHDLLHLLQVRFFDVVRYQEARFQEDEDAQSTVEGAEHTLRSVIADLRAVIKAAQSNEIEDETVWIDDLAHAQATLAVALEKRDTKLLHRANLQVSRVLAQQPTRINRTLTAAAKAMDLVKLLDCMHAVLNHMQGADIPTAKTDEFKHGLDALTNLHDGFSAFAATHNRWQLVENDLIMLETSLNQYKDASAKIDFDELDVGWQSLIPKIAPLWRNSSEPWSVNLQRLEQQIESSITAQDFNRLRAPFRAFRREARDEFVRVDGHLKKLCGELVSVGKPMSAVLRMMA